MDTLLVLNDTIATKINAVVLQMSPCTEKAEKTLHEVAETNHWDFLIVLSICIMIAYIFWICSKRLLKYTESANKAKEDSKRLQHEFEIAKKQFEEVDLKNSKRYADYDFFDKEMDMKEKKLEFDKKQTDEDIRKKRLENACEIEKKMNENEGEANKTKKKNDCDSDYRKAHSEINLNGCKVKMEYRINSDKKNEDTNEQKK